MQQHNGNCILLLREQSQEMNTQILNSSSELRELIDMILMFSPM